MINLQGLSEQEGGHERKDDRCDPLICPVISKWESQSKNDECTSTDRSESNQPGNDPSNGRPAFSSPKSEYILYEQDLILIVCYYFVQNERRLIQFGVYYLSSYSVSLTVAG